MIPNRDSSSAISQFEPQDFRRRPPTNNSFLGNINSNDINTIDGDNGSLFNTFVDLTVHNIRLNHFDEDNSVSMMNESESDNNNENYQNLVIQSSS